MGQIVCPVCRQTTKKAFNEIQTNKNVLAYLNFFKSDEAKEKVTPTPTRLIQVVPSTPTPTRLIQVVPLTPTPTPTTTSITTDKYWYIIVFSFSLVI